MNCRYESALTSKLTRANLLFLALLALLALLAVLAAGADPAA
jgi:hypothetical protein